MVNPNNPLTPYGDIVDDQPPAEQQLWKSTENLEFKPDDSMCTICEKKLIVEPGGKLVCPLHGTRGVPK